MVIQLQMPRSTSVKVEEKPWATEFEHLVEPDKEIDLPLFVYNFSDKPVHGTIELEHIPDGWKLAPNHWEITLNPMDPVRLPARFFMSARDGDKFSDNWIKIRGVFGEAGQPILTFRLISFSGEGYNN
ncbi:MAG: hypothetical protein ABIH23_26515 [bacterium]